MQIQGGSCDAVFPASSEVMLKLLMRDHSLKSKDINGKVTASPPYPRLLTCLLTVLLVKNQPRGGNGLAGLTSGTRLLSPTSPAGTQSSIWPSPCSQPAKDGSPDVEKSSQSELCPGITWGPL